MKKMSIIAAIAVAAVFTACGDDDSSSTAASTDVGCKVTTTDNSATATSSVGGYSTTSTFTLTEDGYKISYGGYGAENMPETDVPTKVTKEELVQMANQVCDMVKD